MIRIGHGYDMHRFSDREEEGTHIVLGGVWIKHPFLLMAHSDGDVLLHALCDALLGAAALGDIGHHFPDSDPGYRNADSRELLRQVVVLITKQGYRVVNVDATLVAEAPKMAPHIPYMRERIASDIEVGTGDVNIKATTTEGLGAVGRREGIAAHAVVLIEQ